MKEQKLKRASGKRWLSTALIAALVTSSFSWLPVRNAEAASAVQTDPGKVYVSLKNADFGASNPLAAGVVKGVEESKNGIDQLGSFSTDYLQFNYGKQNPKYNPAESIVGFLKKTVDGTPKDIVRLAASNQNTAFGSVFNQQRVTLSDNRSFSTYFSFKMEGGSQADGIVFALQTASNEAGASGGGLGYSGVQKSIGVEYDTYYNVGIDQGQPRNDPPPVEGVTGNRSSHVALVKNGDVNHGESGKASADNGVPVEGKNMATLDLLQMSLAQTNTEATADPYKAFHSWIDYNGLTHQFRVYLIRENNDGTYWAPVVGANGMLDRETIGGNSRIKTVKLASFPIADNGQLIAELTGNQGTVTVQPILADTTDLSKQLLQDDVFMGFTAATGGATQNHDIYSWHFNNFSGLIAPQAAVTPQEAVEQAPTGIQILNRTTLQLKDGTPVGFNKATNFENKPYGTNVVPVSGGGTTENGIVATGSKASVEAEVRTIKDKLIEGYPVTFSLYYVEKYANVNIGSGRTAIAATQKDDEPLYLTAEGYTVKTRYYDRDGQTITVREITVPTDTNGIATVNVWNMGDPKHLTNVKARIGGELNGITYGGGNFDSAPVLFEEAIAPQVEKAEVGPDRRTVIVELDKPVAYDKGKPGGFSINIGTDTNPVLVPLKVKDFVKDPYGEEDPFRLVLEVDPSDPAFPPHLPTDYVIPAGSKPPLQYDKDAGSVKGAGPGGAPLESFPISGGTGVEIVNRFAPTGMSVVNDQERSKIEVSFPGDVVVPNAAVDAFKVTINNGVDPEYTITLNDVNAELSVDPSSPDKLSILLKDDRIPLNAKVSLTYSPDKLDPSERIKDTQGSELDVFVNDPVKNQMKPQQAVVINDTTRDKVKVTFSKPLDPASVANSVYAFSFTIDGSLEVKPNAVELGADGKSLVFTLGDGLPQGGIPVLQNETDPTNIVMNYATGQANPSDSSLIDVREMGPNGRSLGWLTEFPVANQLWFEPEKAAVDNDRNKVKVKFSSETAVEGSPEIWVTVYSETGQPRSIPVASIDGGGTDTLTLTLGNGEQIPPGAKVELSYSPNGGSIVDADDPERTLKPQSGFPVSNVYVTIDTPADGWKGSRPVTQIAGKSEAGSDVTIVVRDGQNVVVDGTLTTSPDGSWSWVPDAPISANGKYTVEATAKGAFNTTDEAVSAFTMDSSIPLGGGVELKANPLRNVGDGETSTTLTATVKDSNGYPVAGAKVTFEVPAAGGRFVDANGNPLSVPEALTGPDGKAVIYYQSPDLTGQPSVQEIEVKASVFDLSHDVSGEAAFTIYFEPPRLKGKLTETFDSVGVVPLAGKTVIIRGEDGSVVGSVQTDANGEYEFLIPSKQKYTIEYTQTVAGGQTIVYRQKAVVDKPLKGDGTDEVKANKAVAGVLGGKDADGKLRLIDFSVLDGLPSAPSFVAFLKKGNEYVNAVDPSGSLLQTAGEGDGFAIDEKGLFIADGLPQGNTAADNEYQLEIRYYYNVLDGSGNVTGRNYVVINVKRDGGLPSVTVQSSGELNINEELIDPYGDITNSSTGNVINDRDVKVTIWYADTVRNRNNGITPGPVTLPKLPGFPPADNDSPTQTVSGGAYAWMVYGDSDYYITAEANGYYSYDSRADKGAHPESSVYTENGQSFIKVDRSIVRFDFAMVPASSGGGSTTQPSPSPTPTPTPTPTPGAPNLIVNVQTDRTVHPEQSNGTIDVLYKNDGSAVLEQGQIRLKLPEGVQVIDAAGGKVLAGAIVWDVKDVKAGASGSFRVVLQWPALAEGEQERTVVLKSEFADRDGKIISASTLQLLVYSNRAGNLQHQRYILGYPDGTFKADRFLNRAELAAIIARLIGEYDAEAKPYSDVPKSHWAYKYINTVTKHNIFQGGTDGKFRPNDPVTRGELAAVMTRYLKLETGTPIELHYSDVKGSYWAAAAIESLYRNGMTTGYPDGTFKPLNGIIRSEAVTLINRMLYRGPLTGVEQTWPDIAPSFWAFGQIEEASVSHESTRAEVDGKTVEVFVKRLQDQVR
ncbi:S-layer homology domain-containing protein [Paenibacillus sp. NPDC058071]|uniref:S-layer homology domain-containing protein n=1 Tax=Paenibacillus sp. NPDC058071 TaxID=3346326 RepID=UPI0036DF8D6D